MFVPAAPRRGIFMAPGNAPGVRLLTYLLYGSHRTVGSSDQSICRTAGDRGRARLVAMTVRAGGQERDIPMGGRSRPLLRRPAINPLQRLIRERLTERDWSYGEVARRGGLPRSTVYTLATTRNLVRPPRPATIDALARGLDVPVSAVRAAAAESTGLHYYDEAGRTGAFWRSGARATDRQHRRTNRGGPTPCGRARRIPAEEGLATAHRRVTTGAIPLSLRSFQEPSGT